MAFKFQKLTIPDVILVIPELYGDERGFFMETYRKSVFKKAGITEDFKQDNHSRSKKNVLRGLHYQLPPMEQAKLVRCIKGKIFDVAVDIRKGSPTYGKWVGEYLSEKNKNILFIPAGFAHGYLVMEDKSEIVYKVTKEYSKEHERGLFWNDPELEIKWPVSSAEPILSEKDKNLPLLKDAEVFI
jgi:dTDP-4-dehydrorhamnose 3,5-epimerase